MTEPNKNWRDHWLKMRDWLGFKAQFDPTRCKWCGRILGVILVGAAAFVVLGPLFHLLKAIALGQQDAVRNYGLLMVAVLGAPFVVWRSFVAQQQATTAEEGLITDRINKAVEGLGAEKTVKQQVAAENGGTETREVTLPNLEVRLGAIYALERIAQDSDRDHVRVMEILCAYIRENAPARDALDHDLGPWPDWPENATELDWKERTEKLSLRRQKLTEWVDDLRTNHRPRADIQAALIVMGRRSSDQIKVEKRFRSPIFDDGYRLDLRDTNLQGAPLHRLDFNKALFSNSRLEAAVFQGTELNETEFQRSNMEGTYFGGAKLDEANFSYARLEQASFQSARANAAPNFEGSSLQRAGFASFEAPSVNFNWTVMEGVDFRNAKVTKRASFAYSSLQQAELMNASIESADFTQANLDLSDCRDVSLRYANWTGTTLGAVLVQGADLRGGHALKQEQLSYALGRPDTLLPMSAYGEDVLYTRSCWTDAPAGFHTLLLRLRNNHVRPYAFPRDQKPEDFWRDQLFCSEGKCACKTGTPLSIEGDPPWGALGVDEDEAAYKHRRRIWTADQPPGPPIDKGDAP